MNQKTKIYLLKSVATFFSVITVFTTMPLQIFAENPSSDVNTNNLKVKEELNERLIKAAHSGDKDECQRLISQGANVNYVNEFGVTALLEAALQGNVEVSELLLNNHAEVNCKDKNGQTPLHYAAMMSKLELCRLLVDHGAYVNVRDNEGQKPIDLACNSLNVENLLKELNERLIKAAHSGDKDECQRLISQGANVNYVNEFGATALLEAAFQGNVEVSELLLNNHAEVNCKDKNGQTPLHYAAMMSKFELCILLVAHGAYVNVRDNEGQKPIDLAGNSLNVENLLRKPYKAMFYPVMPPSLDPQEELNERLIKFVRLGDKDACQHLISQGANVTYVNQFGATALLEAATQGNVEIFELLKNHINRAYKIIYPVNISALSKWELFNLLTHHDPNTPVNPISLLPILKDLPDFIPLTPSSTADRSVFCIAARLVDEKLIEFAYSGDKDECQRLISQGANVNYVNEFGITALLEAAFHGNVEVSELLLNNHAEVNCKDKNGQTPLHYAAMMSKLELCRLLVAHGADVNARDNEGQKPIDLACNSLYIKNLLRNPPKSMFYPSSLVINEPISKKPRIE